MAPNEKDIDSALNDLKQGIVPSVLQAAKKWNVSYTTLNRRFRHGQVSVEEFHHNSQSLLIEAQEDALINWIETCKRASVPPTHAQVRAFVEQFLGHNIGNNWVTRFVTWRKDDLVGR